MTVGFRNVKIVIKKYFHKKLNYAQKNIAKCLHPYFFDLSVMNELKKVIEMS